MSRRTDIHKVLIIGSGPIIIGQACEFDYSGTQACKALRRLGYEIVLVNSNPATIMTDPETADVTYIEPLNVERLEQIIARERKIYKGVSPNVDFFSGFAYSMLNLPLELYTPIFAIARISGWSAHRLEELNYNGKIMRPAYKNVQEHLDYIPMSQR